MIEIESHDTLAEGINTVKTLYYTPYYTINALLWYVIVLNLIYVLPGFLSHKLSIVILNTLTVTKGNIGYFHFAG